MRVGPGGAAIAVVALVGVPVVIGQTASSEQPAEAKPAEAALTVELSDDQKLGSEEAVLRIEAAGEPPLPGVELLNADGSKAVPVKSVDASECSKTSTLKAVGKDADSVWCLKLTNIDDGTQVTGKLAGERTNLTLTVSRRSGFWPGPFWAALLGIGLGTLALMLPQWLQKGIRRGLVNKALTENENRGGDEIEGLRGWVDRQRKLNQKDDELVPLVDWVMREGPGIAAAGRAELLARLAESSLPKDAKYRKGAEEFLADREKPHVDDFFSDGKPISSYPTDEWVKGLEKLELQQPKLRKLKEEVDALADPEKAREALEEAERHFAAADDPEEVEATEAKIDAVQLLLPPRAPSRHVLGRERFQLVAPPDLSGLEIAVEPQQPPAPPSSPRGLSTELGLNWLGFYRALGVLLFLATVVLALLTINYTVYEAIPAFGSDDADWFKVISAGIAAGVGSTVVTLRAPWNPRKAVGD